MAAGILWTALSRSSRFRHKLGPAEVDSTLKHSRSVHSLSQNRLFTSPNIIVPQGSIRIFCVLRKAVAAQSCPLRRDYHAVHPLILEVSVRDPKEVMWRSVQMSAVSYYIARFRLLLDEQR